MSKNDANVDVGSMCRYFGLDSKIRNHFFLIYQYYDLGSALATKLNKNINQKYIFELTNKTVLSGYTIASRTLT